MSIVSKQMAGLKELMNSLPEPCATDLARVIVRRDENQDTRKACCEDREAGTQRKIGRKDRVLSGLPICVLCSYSFFLVVAALPFLMVSFRLSTFFLSLSR